MPHIVRVRTSDGSRSSFEGSLEGRRWRLASGLAQRRPGRDQQLDHGRPPPPHRVLQQRGALPVLAVAGRGCEARIPFEQGAQAGEITLGDGSVGLVVGHRDERYHRTASELNILSFVGLQN